MARKKKTSNQIAFQKERKRLLQAVNRATKQGYIFDEDFTIPETPKRVTKKALEKIKQTKPKEMYEKAVFLDVETGEVVPALEHRKEVKKVASKRAYEKRKKKTTKVEYYPTIDIIERMRSLFSTIERQSYPFIPVEARKDELVSILDDTVDENEANNSLETYIDYLKANESEILTLVQEIEYASTSEEVQSTFVQVGRLINQKSLSFMQAERLSEDSERGASY